VNDHLRDPHRMACPKLPGGATEHVGQKVVMISANLAYSPLILL
jgi:hypothetical protein